MSKPKLIFFDAAGTLFEVRGSVGEIYRRFVQRYGVTVEPDALQQRFAQSFGQQPPLAFRDYQSEAELRRLEFAWWRRLVRQVFAGLEVQSFDDFFAEVFEFFRQPEAWRLYEDVLPTLTELQARDIQLAVLSNFDTRLEALLRGFDLSRYFARVHLSSRLGAAKPAARIFQAALRVHAVPAHAAWHVGDSWREDVLGARAAGLGAWLIDRSRANTSEEASRLTRLDQLIGLTG